MGGDACVNALRKRRLLGSIPTQREVAKALGVENSAVSKWERGINKPRADKLPQLAKLYGCTVDELLGEETQNENSIAGTVLDSERTRETS